MGAFSDDFDKFRDVNALVLPISVDSIPTLNEFKAKEKLSLDLLSDFKREVSRKYGTLLEEKFFSNRAYILIDKQGTVRWVYAEQTPATRRENEEIFQQLRALS